MEKVEKKYYYSEIFHSIQGEGHYTGVPTAWIRFFLCNLQCNGFGQKDPTDPSTYELPFENFDVSSVKRVEDLPVWEKGCDSSYTWAKKYKHLMGQETPQVLANKIVDVLKNEDTFVIVEQVSAMPGQGVTSMFNFGQTFGSIKGICAALKLPIFYVRPAKWKKHFELINSSKDASRTKVIEMYPSISSRLTKKKDVNKADAILIARYFRDCRSQFNN